jgi:serine/threonine-protein phosphatase 4 regulatory subunit 2
MAVRKTLFAQLDDFDECVSHSLHVDDPLSITLFPSTPFTIQRLVDLCMRSRENYTALGKYCRALEKTLYVKLFRLYQPQAHH